MFIIQNHFSEYLCIELDLPTKITTYWNASKYVGFLTVLNNISFIDREKYG